MPTPRRSTKGKSNTKLKTKAVPRIIHVLNGPNLNLLGTREPEIYGRTTLRDIEHDLAAIGKQHNAITMLRQSNHEGDLIDWLHEARAGANGVILNAGAFAHTSIALHDALRLLAIPVIEVHLSNTLAREPFRHHSYIAPVADAVIMGCGAAGYRYALLQLINILEK